MTDLTKSTLAAARSLLWQLLVEHDRGEIDLRGQWRAQVDTMEQICSDVLKYEEGESADSTEGETD